MAEKTAAERILEAAAELFADRGYQATTTRMLAERAEVNEVTIFRLFGSKLGVLSALGERLLVPGATQRAAAKPLPDDLREAVLQLAEGEVVAASTYGAFAMRVAFDAHSVPELAEVIGEGPSMNAHAVTEFFAEQQRLGRVRPDVEPSVMADAFFALTSTYVMSRQLMPAAAMSDLSAEAAVRQLMEVFLAGIEQGSA